ncbi:hypothetical protein AGMMS49546_06440 [Spirochaetia bacterium]|nr:hypothetical protein AGMMS49546_06440 [Spirochaetia bacterium]
MERIFRGKARICVINTAEDSVEYIFVVPRKEVEAAEKQEESSSVVLKKIPGVRSVSLVDQNDEVNQ